MIERRGLCGVAGSRSTFKSAETLEIYDIINLSFLSSLTTKDSLVVLLLTMASLDEYQSPFNSRYCSKQMKELFSPRRRFSTWRQLWVWLAQSQQELGLYQITDDAVLQMQQHVTIQDDEFPIIAEEEKRRRHDVMAHCHGFGLRAPKAEGIIHLG